MASVYANVTLLHKLCIIHDFIFWRMVDSLPPFKGCSSAPE
uniref:Uncharacterized protein n=1 Tax=Solanum lycopersicum TaxID=4081 RepID=K4CTR2_SOLLC